MLLKNFKEFLHSQNSARNSNFDVDLVILSYEAGKRDLYFILFLVIYNSMIDVNVPMTAHSVEPLTSLHIHVLYS